MDSEINVHPQTFHLICRADKMIVSLINKIFIDDILSSLTVFWMCMRHVICSMIYSPSSPCRSAVPGGPHVLCVRGIGGHKEIRETQRWRKHGRH